MQANYTPPDYAALCPHCAASITVFLARPEVRCAVLTITCPACHGEWDELRTPTGTRRYWDAAAVTKEAARG